MKGFAIVGWGCNVLDGDNGGPGDDRGWDFIRPQDLGDRLAGLAGMYWSWHRWRWVPDGWGGRTFA